MASVEGIVTEKINAKKVMMFSKSFCPFGQKAKAVFERLINKGKLSLKDYEVMEIENDPNCDAYQEYFQKLTGARSVPRVFINGKFFGGGDEVEAADRDGSLVKLLK